MTSRLILTAALLLLGSLALARLPLDYLPRQSFPELTVALTLPAARTPAEVSREWVEEIENAVRSLGRVRGVVGEVRADGAELTVRFAPGTDALRRAARLESDLAALRRRLPAGARLTIDPAGQAAGELLALVWLSGTRGDADVEAAAEALRSIPGVRQVDALGLRREELRIELAAGTLDPRATAAAVQTAIRQALRRPELGRVVEGDRRLPLIVPEETPETLARLPVPLAGGGAVPLGTLATLHPRRPDPLFRVRYHGVPARALLVWRASGAPLLATDRELRRRLATLRAQPAPLRAAVDESEAEPLRGLLGRLALGGLLASLAAAALGFRFAGRWAALSMGLSLPIGVAAAACALWVAGIPLDVLTLTALALGTTAVLPAAAARLDPTGERRAWALAATLIASAAAVPWTVALSGDQIGSLLAQPARAFWLAVAASVLAAAVLPGPHPTARPSPPTPLPSPTHPIPGRGGNFKRALLGKLSAKVLPSPGGGWKGDGRGAGGEGLLRALQRRALRDPGTAALALFTAGAAVAALCGAALVPKAGDLSPDGGSFNVRLRLPDGATLEETERQVRQVEARLAKAPEVEGFWSSAWAGRGLVRVAVRPADRQPDRLNRLATRIRYGLPGAAAARIETGAGAAGGRPLVFDLEDRAKTDGEAQLYRFVARSADLDALTAAYARILDRLSSLKVRRFWIDGWGEPSVLFGLHPAAGTDAGELAALARALDQATSAPSSVALPTRADGVQRSLVVVPAGAPLDPDGAVPALSALLRRPMRLDTRVVAPSSVVTLRQDAVQPRVERQSGRFVVPVDLQIPFSSKEVRIARRREIDRALTQLRLPAGVELERPVLGFHLWDAERARIAALILAIPLLLFAVAACRLGAPLRALVALVPPAAGLLAAMSLVQATLGQVDELTVFALAASLSLALPLAAEIAGAAGLGSETGAALYRGLRRDSPWLLAAGVPAALAWAAPTFGADFIRCRWVVPLRSAALAGTAALIATLVVAPALRSAMARWRQHDPEDARRRRQPPAWSAPGEPVLTVRSVTKTYASGHTALSRVGFELGPGITGLLGPNGAGKTTLLRLLTGLLAPTRGSVSFRGVPVTPEDLAAYRVRIGFLPQEFNAYPDFTAEQFLDHWALERGMEDARARQADIERLLAAVGLAEHARRKVRDFSGGMRQRVGIARALLGMPPILIVDEPTTGLDIESRGRFRQILLEQAADRIVLFSTHIASDVEAAASRILLLHRGRLRFDGPPEDLVERARGRVFAALLDDADLAAFGCRYRVTARVRILEGIQVRAVARPGVEPAGALVEPNLEEAYLAEIERVDAAEGRERAAESFSFLNP